MHLQLPIRSMNEYNQLLTSRSFWDGLTEKVLIFQHDAGLLKERIEEFLEWEYVGAPWSFQHDGGNGGLSLRSRDAMIKVIENVPYDGTMNEDIYFCHGLKELGLNLAPREVCEKFSVESVFKMGTLGWHGIDTWLTPDQCREIRGQYA